MTDSGIFDQERMNQKTNEILGKIIETLNEKADININFGENDYSEYLKKFVLDVDNYQGKNVSEILREFMNKEKGITDYVHLTIIVGFCIQQLYKQYKDEFLQQPLQFMKEWFQHDQQSVLSHFFQLLATLNEFKKKLQTINTEQTQNVDAAHGHGGAGLYVHNTTSQQRHDTQDFDDNNQYSQTPYETEDKHGGNLKTVSQAITNIIKKKLNQYEGREVDSTKKQIYRELQGGSILGTMKDKLIDVLKKHELNFNVGTFIEGLFEGNKQGGGKMTKEQQERTKIQKKIMNDILGKIMKQIGKEQKVSSIFQKSMKSQYM